MSSSTTVKSDIRHVASRKNKPTTLLYKVIKFSVPSRNEIQFPQLTETYIRPSMTSNIFIMKVDITNKFWINMVFTMPFCTRSQKNEAIYVPPFFSVSTVSAIDTDTTSTPTWISVIPHDSLRTFSTIVLRDDKFRPTIFASWKWTSFPTWPVRMFVILYDTSPSSSSNIYKKTRPLVRLPTINVPLNNSRPWISSVINKIKRKFLNIVSILSTYTCLRLLRPTSFYKQNVTLRFTCHTTYSPTTTIFVGRTLLLKQVRTFLTIFLSSNVIIFILATVS